MSKELIARLRKNREVRVTVGKFVFIAHRPTDVEVLQIRRNDDAYTSIAMDFVHGWEGVVEDDIIGGGGTDVVAFTSDLWREWVADHTEYWEPITDAVLAAYRAHTGIVGEAAKN